VIIPANDVTKFVQSQVGLPPAFFLSIAKAKINADGSLQANYNYDNSGAPPPPQLLEAEANA